MSTLMKAITAKRLIISLVLLLFVQFLLLSVTYLFLLPTFIIIYAIDFLVVCSLIGLLIKFNQINIIKLLSIVFCIILITSTYFAYNYSKVGGKDNARLVYRIYPVVLDVMVEDGINFSYCSGIINATCQVINSISNVSIEIGSINMFPNDNRSYYDNSSVQIYLNKNFACARYDTRKNGEAIVHLYCLRGISDNFTGKANIGGPGVVILFKDNEIDEFWTRVHVLIHELGHTFGSDHSENKNEIMYESVNMSYLPPFITLETQYYHSKIDYSLYLDEFNKTLANSSVLFSYSEISDYVNFEDNISSKTRNYITYVYNQMNSSFEEYGYSILIGTEYKDMIKPFSQIFIQKKEIPFTIYNDLWILDVQI